MLRKLILVLLTAASTAAMAASMVARKGDDYIRITKDACPAEQAQKFPEGYEPFRSITVLNGHEYKGCWTLVEDRVVILYDDGDMGQLSVEDFKPDPGV